MLSLDVLQETQVSWLLTSPVPTLMVPAAVAGLAVPRRTLVPGAQRYQGSGPGPPRDPRGALSPLSRTAEVSEGGRGRAGRRKGKPTCSPR